MTILVKVRLRAKVTPRNYDPFPHYVVMLTVTQITFLQAQAKIIYWSRQPCKPRNDTIKISKPELVQKFNNTLMKKLGKRSTSRKCNKLRNTIHCKNDLQDMWLVWLTVMMPVIEDKLSAHVKYINLPNSQNILALRDARKSSANCQKTCKRIMGLSQSKNSNCWKYSWNVRRNQENYRVRPEKDIISKVIYWCDT